jgi:hypothetical protein
MFQSVSLTNIAAFISLIGTVIAVPHVADVDGGFVKFHINRCDDDNAFFSPELD